MLKKQLPTYLSLATADVLGVLLSLGIGILVRRDLLPRVSPLFADGAPLRQDYLWLLALGIGLFAYEGLYTRRRTAWEEFRYILRGVTVAFVLFLAAMTLLKRGEAVSRPALLVAWLMAPGLLIALRLGGKRLLRRTSFWPRRILVVGCNAEALQLANHLSLFPEMGYFLAGFLAGAGEDPGRAGEKLGSFEELEKVVLEQDIDEIILALPGCSRLQQFDYLMRAEALVPKVSVLPGFFDADKLNVEVEQVERYFLLSFQNNLMKRSNRVLKRVFELTILMVALPFWLPFVCFLMLLVELSSPGPVFFKQKRIGAKGKTFFCYKFRTMVADADAKLAIYLAENADARSEWAADRKLKEDPRITKIGRFLRKTSLDELPQIFNVLKGEMSLVGPRPIVFDEIEKYQNNFRYYKSVCPGISGLWQVSGRNNLGYYQRVMLDTFYVRNWSLWMDFVILLKTFPAVLKKNGAY